MNNYKLLSGNEALAQGAYEARGKIKRDLKDYKGALEDFDKALEIDANGWMRSEPDKPNIGIQDLEYIALVYIQRGEIKAELGDFDGAIEDMNRALGIGTKSWMSLN